MCRRNHLLSCCAAFFGLGLLVGRGMESGLLTLCLGLGLIILAVACLRKK